MDLHPIKQRYGIIGQDPRMEDALKTALLVAKTDCSVLITGENGVGKENIARIIHDYSPRRNNTFIAINCGAIPEGTIDSELFGHEKGAFTNATEQRKGYFEKANGGTIFLDEVGDLPFSTQIRLLRVLETGEFLRVGASTALKTDVRVVAATNADMLARLDSGKFREDLYYRLNTIPIHVPPLRERKDDIFLLLTKFATDCAAKYKMPQIQFDDEAIKVAESYSWPGNIRQLKHVVENISIVEQDRNITGKVFQKYIDNAPAQRHLPALVSSNSQSYQYNHEALLAFIKELKKEVDDLKHIVHELLIRHPSQNAYNQEYTHPTHAIPHIPSDAHVQTHEVQYIEDKDDDIEFKTEDENFSLDQNEKTLIIKALEKHSGNRRAAAAELGISERTLYRKISEYGL